MFAVALNHTFPVSFLHKIIGLLFNSLLVLVSVSFSAPWDGSLVL